MINNVKSFPKVNKLCTDKIAFIRPDLDIFQKWELRWDMQFNPSKCQVIHITRSRSPIPTEYTLHGENIEVVECARYLGVDIAHDLSWKTHVRRFTNNANKSLGYLRRNLRSKTSHYGKMQTRPLSAGERCFSLGPLQQECNNENRKSRETGSSVDPW